MDEQMLNEQVETAIEETVVETKQVKSGLATAAMVLGILALITTLFFINYIFGLIGLILGIVYLVKKGEKKAKGRAIAGLVCTVLSLAISTFIWGSVINYFTTTDITTMMNDLATVTGGAVDPMKDINAAIESALGEGADISTIENMIGRELSVETIMEFKGDASVEEIMSFAETVDMQAVANDLGGEITYEKIEEKLGKDFTFEDIKAYVESLPPSGEGTPGLSTEMLEDLSTELMAE